MRTTYCVVKGWRVMKPAFKNLGNSVELTLIVKDPDGGEYERIIIQVSEDEIKMLEEMKEAISKALEGKEFEVEEEEEETVGLG